MQKIRKINRIYFIGIFIFLCGAISFTSYYFIKFHNRKEIVELEKKYSGYIPTELIVLLVLSIIMILVGKFI